MVETLTKEERRLKGASRRKKLPRSGQGRWKTKDAQRDAMAILQRASGDRVPRLLELKYERMAESPFGYFRGAVPVMAHDLGAQAHTGICNQLCGDAHLRNLGAFAGPDGRLVFDINDFDETIRGPFEWDVKRLATSLYLGAREAGESESECREAVRLFLRRYRKSMDVFAEMPVLELGRYQIHRESDLAAVAEVFAKAERSTPVHLRDGLTEPREGAKSARRKKNAKGEPKPVVPDRVFRSEPPVLQRLTAAKTAEVLDCLPTYLKTIEPERRHLLSRYRAVDAAFKVVGTGSVGLRDYCIYFEGNGAEDPLFLQVKQEVESAWAPYLPKDLAEANRSDKQGLRVVRGQRAMQVQSDPFLGYTRVGERDFLVRQLNDHKGSVNLGTLDAEALAHYADLCGELLARGHARSGEPNVVAGYLGKGEPFEKGIAEFAESYADQTEKDWKQLKKVRQG